MGTKHYKPLMKLKFSVKKLRKPNIKKVRLKSEVKTMLIIFYDLNGIIHKEFILQDKIVDGDYYLCYEVFAAKRLGRVLLNIERKLLHDNSLVTSA